MGRSPASVLAGPVPGEQSLSSPANTPYHDDMAYLGQQSPTTYPYVVDYGPPTPQPSPGSQPSPQAMKPQGPRSWGKWAVFATASVAALSVALVAGFAAGRATSDINAPAPITVTAAPGPKTFNASDAEWCRGYDAESSRLKQQRKDLGWPRDIAGRDVSASSWTTDEAQANKGFATYLDSLKSDSMRQLQDRVSNPVIKSLIDTQMLAVQSLSQRLRDGTYVPSDYALAQSLAASSVALEDVCQEIAGG
ncbi:Uncharacterised protein [Mycobacteroides abscessus subsp. abscessus]|nr:Uncharacterised protein [Mycobacteroides abscessus subsp. abscessus]